MPTYAIKDIRLTDALTVTIGVEITCPAMKEPRYKRGVIVGAWFSIFPYVEIEYGPFRETRRLDPEGKPE